MVSAIAGQPARRFIDAQPPDVRDSRAIEAILWLVGGDGWQDDGARRGVDGRPCAEVW